MSISTRIHEVDLNSLSLEMGFAILGAYSTIARYASESNKVSETNQKKAQVVHELLNGLIENYYQVVSFSNDVTVLHFTQGRLHANKVQLSSRV